MTKNLVVQGDRPILTQPGHPRGAYLRAYDQKTGQEVGAVYMPAPQSGSPMTYTYDGKQYIMVAVSRRQLLGRLSRLRLAARPVRLTHKSTAGHRKMARRFLCPSSRRETGHFCPAHIGQIAPVLPDTCQCKT